MPTSSAGIKTTQWKSRLFQLRPWQVTFDGLCAKPGTFDIDDLMGMPFSHLEERVYDFRCAEAWSMVIPYNGRPLKDILRVVEPWALQNMLPSPACCDRSRCRARRLPSAPSIGRTPVEALTIEEAMNPLTFATFGVYGIRICRRTVCRFGSRCRGSTGSSRQSLWCVLP